MLPRWTVDGLGYPQKITSWECLRIIQEQNFPATADNQKIDTTDSIWGQALFIFIVIKRKELDILGISAPAVLVKGFRTPFLFYLQSLLGIIANSPGVKRKR
jgi:hypothetical protein